MELSGNQQVIKFRNQKKSKWDRENFFRAGAAGDFNKLVIYWCGCLSRKIGVSIREENRKQRIGRRGGDECCGIDSLSKTMDGTKID